MFCSIPSGEIPGHDVSCRRARAVCAARACHSPSDAKHQPSARVSPPAAAIACEHFFRVAYFPHFRGQTAKGATVARARPLLAILRITAMSHRRRRATCSLVSRPQRPPGLALVLPVFRSAGGSVVYCEYRRGSLSRGCSCFADMQKSPPEGVSVGLEDDNLFTWEVMVVGPPGTF